MDALEQYRQARDEELSRGMFATHKPYLGKFSSAMASYLYDRMMQGDEGDEWETDSEASGDWASRYGRRILFGDDRGFVDCDRFDNADEAMQAMERWRKAHV